ncbi:MAG: hypothetical protein M0006_07360 [Magnetospirillum sp.]|nr:hypothetical protein [Magnetospirillum sp.]
MVSRFLRPSAAALSLLTLSACSTNSGPPACPPVYILSDANKLTKFRPGTGRDVTDVDVQAEIVGYHGDCKYEEKKDGGWTVDVSLQVSMDVKRGPANTSRTADLTYFVAMPAFYPTPQAKAEFPVTISFPEGTNLVHHVDDTVDLTFPIKAKEIIDKYEIYLGFQTTAEELRYNRRTK